jgi:hypothetical protein
MEGEQKPQSILERLKSAKETLEVSRRELEHEFVRLSERGDEPAKKELSDVFDAYLSWELRESPKDQTPDDIRSRALRNFDFVARVADTRLAWGDDISTLSMVNNEENLNRIGKVRQFFRDAVDYNPSNPPSPLNN